MGQVTPGPWIAQPGTTTGREIVAPNAPKNRRIIARCGGPDREANASLIAAASDLLAAAIAARDSAGWSSMSEAEQRTILHAIDLATPEPSPHLRED